MDRRKLIVIGAIVLVLLLGTTAAVEVKRMSALVSFTVSGGIVQETPEQVAAAVSAKLGRTVPVDVVALATCIDSEEAGAPRIVRVGVGWAVYNTAGRSRSRILSTLCPSGKFGGQNAGNHYASTARPPTADGITIAEAILDGREPDPTGGATNFDSPKAQRAALARSTKGYKRTPEQVAAKRVAAGFQLVTLAGVSAEDFRMWRKA